MKATPVDHERWLYPTVTLAALFTLWQLSGGTNHPSGSGTPVPSEILRSLAAEPRFYASRAGVTIFEAVAGLALAISLAFTVASAFALSGAARKALMPLVIASQTVPLVAVAPLLSRLIGDGIGSRIVVAAWLCWFPAVVSATHGMLDVDPRLFAVFETYRASRGRIFWKLRLPHSLAALVAGIRTTAGFALIGAIVAEYSGAQDGLGAYIMEQTIHRTDSVRLFGVVVVSSVAGLLMTEATYLVSRRVLRRYLPANG